MFKPTKGWQLAACFCQETPNTSDVAAVEDVKKGVETLACKGDCCETTYFGLTMTNHLGRTPKLSAAFGFWSIHHLVCG